MPTKKSNKSKASTVKRRSAAKNNKTSKKVQISKSNADQPTIRKLKRPQYKTFRVSKRIKHPGPALSPASKLFWRSLINIKRNWLIFLGMTLIYMILTLALVKSFSLSIDIEGVKESLQVITGTSIDLKTGITLFGGLLLQSGPSSDVAAAYQSLLLVIMSLVIIWTLRQTQAGIKIRIKDPFYKGLYPLVPMIIVLFVIGLQTIPLLVSNFLYQIVFGNGIAVLELEKVAWIMIFFLLAVLTLYMVTSSLFALYIVTLPNVEPLQALRSARELVRYRRWTIMRKLLFLPLALMVIGAIITVPLIIYMTFAVEWVFFCLSIMTLILVHSYMYALYRELLA